MTAVLNGPLHGIREIALSRGDLALVLAGKKTLHYLPASPALTPGETIMLTSEGEENIRFPVRVAASSNVRNQPLTMTDRVAAGRYVPARKVRRNRPETQPNRELFNFYPSYCITDDLGTAPHYQRVEFGLLQSIDLNAKTPHETVTNVRQVLQLYARAAQSLEPHLRRSHRYHFQLPDHISSQRRAEEERRSKRHDLQLAGGLALQPASPRTKHEKRIKIRVSQPSKQEYAQQYRVDSTTVDAVSFLRHTDTGAFNPLMKSLYAPALGLSTHLKTLFPQGGQRLNSARNQIDRRARSMEMAHLTRLEVPPGNAALLGMGAVDRVAVAMPRFNAAPFSGFHEEDTQGIVMLSAVEDRVHVNPHSTHGFSLPVVIDLADAPIMFASEVTDELAKSAGHATADAMRKSMNIRQGQDPVIHFFRGRAVQPHELDHHDLPKAQSRYHALMTDVGEAWEKSNDPSMKRARTFLEQLPERQQRRALRRIASPDVLVTDPDAIPNRNLTRPVPALLQRAWRLPVAEKIARKPRPQPAYTPTVLGETIRASVGPDTVVEEFQPVIIDPDELFAGVCTEPQPFFGVRVMEDKAPAKAKPTTIVGARRREGHRASPADDHRATRHNVRVALKSGDTIER